MQIPEDQIILIDKPASISSFGVVAKVRAHLRDQFGHKVKVGHTGTLDPFATGLLILLTGKMTKKSSEFLKLDKAYEATLRLGYISSTGDPEGQIQQYKAPEDTLSRSIFADKQIQQHFSEGATTQYKAPEDTLSRSIFADGANTERTSPVTTSASERSEKDVSSVLNGFIGQIEQTPPRFSAIKINGQRAYKLARKGQDFEIPSRQVEIYSINILNYNYPKLKIRVHCSSGTYIRTLAEDIGQKLGTGAYLTALRRLKIADYSVNDALPLSHFSI